VLNYIEKSNFLYHIKPLQNAWFDLKEFADHHLTNPLSPVARMLLTSDGSMTQMLESLLLSKVSMSIERQELIASVGDLNIVESDGREALAREAWLTDGKDPLIYAHSVLLSNNETYSLRSIQEVSQPLGRMLRDNKVKTLRDECRIGIVNSPQIAERLSIDSDSDLWARYYRLTTDSGLYGVIFELFNPALIDF